MTLEAMEQEKDQEKDEKTAENHGQSNRCNLLFFRFLRLHFGDAGLALARISRDDINVIEFLLLFSWRRILFFDRFLFMGILAFIFRHNSIISKEKESRERSRLVDGLMISR